MQVSHCFIPLFFKVFVYDFFVKSSHIFKKPCLIDLRILAVVRLKSAACKYWASSSFEVCSRMLCTTFSDCCVPTGTSLILVFLFRVTLIIFYTLFCMDIPCLSSAMVHPLSHKTPNDINGHAGRPI